MSAILADHGWRLSARHLHLLRYRASRYLSANLRTRRKRMLFAAFLVRRRAAFSNFRPTPQRCWSQIALKVRSGRATENVSQLLAGTRSGPGRSPGAARVPDPRDQTRGRRAPSRLNDRLAMAPFSGRSAAMILGRGEAGIRFSWWLPDRICVLDFTSK